MCSICVIPGMGESSSLSTMGFSFHCCAIASMWGSLVVFIDYCSDYLGIGYDNRLTKCRVPERVVRASNA